jgi:hypothetical protein
MKQLISSVTIGACLLLSSAGDVFAQKNPHPPGTSGQLGTGGLGVAGCGGTAPIGPATQPSPPGQIGNANTKSPFPTSPAGPNPGSAAGKYNVDSQYDNACLHQAP